MSAPLTHQVLAAIVGNAAAWDDAMCTTAGLLMDELRPHHWGDEGARRIAETVQGHLRAGRGFGYNSLAVELPDTARTLQAIRATEPLENLRLGLRELAEQGRKQDVRTALRKADTDLNTLPALTVASGLAEAVSTATSSSAGYRHVSQIGSVVEHLRAMQDRPDSVIDLGPELAPHLRWGGLPVSDTDGETLIICGAQGHAKTALGIALALRSARQGHLTHYDVLADASAYQIRERMVHTIAGLSLRSGLLLNASVPPRGSRPRETVEQRLSWADAVLNGMPLEIDDSSPDMNQHELRTRLALKAARGVRLSVMENLDHMTWDAREERLERRYQLGRLTQIVRQSDRRTGHHTILLAQANRSAVEDGDGIPRRHQAADSDQPARHATFFLGLFNPNVEKGGEATLEIKGRIDKNRSGTTGPVNFPPALINPNLSTPGVPS